MASFVHRPPHERLMRATASSCVAGAKGSCFSGFETVERIQAQQGSVLCRYRCAIFSIAKPFVEDSGSLGDLSVAQFTKDSAWLSLGSFDIDILLAGLNLIALLDTYCENGKNHCRIHYVSFLNMTSRYASTTLPLMKRTARRKTSFFVLISSSVRNTSGNCVQP
jgi:hypothetical protein